MQQVEDLREAIKRHCNTTAYMGQMHMYLLDVARCQTHKWYVSDYGRVVICRMLDVVWQIIQEETDSKDLPKLYQLIQTLLEAQSEGMKSEDADVMKSRIELFLATVIPVST